MSGCISIAEDVFEPNTENASTHASRSKDRPGEPHIVRYLELAKHYAIENGAVHSKMVRHSGMLWSKRNEDDACLLIWNTCKQ